MKNNFLKSLLLIFLVSCSTVPLTKRKQLNILPESQMIAMSLTSYREFLTQHPPVSSSDANVQLVTSVGRRISSAVETYMRQNKMADRIAGYKWEFNLVDSKEANAWCMPGGKIVVYSGLLPISQDEPGLAFIMGHEVAHAIARHGNERMSQMLATQAGGMALDVALQSKSAETRSMFLTAYGVGTTVGALLPYSRLHETEADKLGLIFMAMAGYDPNVAVGLWQRFAASSKGAKPPELLSTHPADQTRINNIRSFMPTAMKYYKRG